LFTPKGAIRIKGKDILNTCSKAPLQPSDPAAGLVENFPWHAEYFGITGDHGGIWGLQTTWNGIPQRDFFLAWLKRFYEGALAFRPVAGQALFIAGPSDFGKNYLSKRVMGIIMDGETSPEDVILRGEKFNKEAGEVAVWSLNDQSGSTNYKERRHLTDTIKRIAASDTMPYQPKYSDSVEIPWLGRLIVTCNTDATSLSILPDLNEYVQDKVMFLMVGEGEYRPVFDARHINNDRAVAEMPFFLRWLMDWEPPKEIVDGVSERFGVLSFHHPKMVESSTKLDSSHHFLEALQEFRKDPAVVEAGEWEGTAGKLLRDMSDYIHNSRSVSPTLIGLWLTQLCESSKAPWLIRTEGRANQTLYQIRRPLQVSDI